MNDSSSSGLAPSLSVALVGSGGAGIATAGELLLEAGRRAGYAGRLTRSFGPQIRGGETAAYVSFGADGAPPPGGAFDLLFALDWNNAERFEAELPVTDRTVVVADEKAGPAPAAFGDLAATLPLTATAKQTGVRANVQLLATVCGWLGLPLADLCGALAERFGRAPDGDGHAVLVERHATPRPAALLELAPPTAFAPGAARWSLNGNEATGLGLLHGGIRNAAAYPITPATELLEWLAPRLEGLGGQLVQAEDELASINMALGAGFGGVPSMTATSGPGLSLMHEGIGLGIAAEIPVVVVNVQRGGPSTGLPTKSEQADLLAGLFGPHGDAPHVVLAPTSVADCAPTASWAAELAEDLQTPVIVQSEQALAQTRIVCPAIDLPAARVARAETVAESGPYRRYAETPSGISPRSVPGDPDQRYVADGLEHAEDGTPTTAAAVHAAQVAKRRRKLDGYDYGDRVIACADGPDDASCLLLTIGSLFDTARTAADRLTAAGTPTRAAALRLLAPARPDALADLLHGTSRVVVIEQNDGAQLQRYLRGWWGLPASAESLARCGPIAISPDEICAWIDRSEEAA